MRFIFKENSERECYDLIDNGHDQSHDGDGAKELVARIYDKNYAILIAHLLNNLNKKE